MKKRLFVFGLILIICFSSFNFAFAELLNPGEKTKTIQTVTIQERLDNKSLPQSIYESEAYQTVSRDKLPDLPPIVTKSATFTIGGNTGTVSFNGDYIMQIGSSSGRYYIDLSYVAGYLVSVYDKDAKTYHIEDVGLCSDKNWQGSSGSRGDKYRSYYDVSNKTWGDWSLISSEPYNGQVFQVGLMIYTNSKINLNLDYNPQTMTQTYDYLGRGSVLDIEYPPCIEPDKPTMQMYNVDDPLPENFYLEVTNPTPFDFYLNVQNSLDSAEPIKQLSGENGVYQFNIEQLGITEAGTYYFLLFNYDGNLIGTKVLTFSSMASGKIYELNVSGYIPNAELTDNKPIVNVTSQGYENLVIMIDYIKVDTMGGSSGGLSNLKFNLDDFFWDNRQNEYVLNYIKEISYTGGGEGGGGGGSWDSDTNLKSKIKLVYGDKIYYMPNNIFTRKLKEKYDLSNFSMKAVTGYHCFSVFYGENEIYSRDFFYSRDHTELPTYDDSKNDKDNGALTNSWDDSGLFQYPELPDGANIIDYIKWICLCVYITITSIITVITNFSLACAKFAKMIGSFFSFLPREFTFMIPIVLAICLLARFLGR